MESWSYEQLRKIGDIGRIDSGVTRLAFTAEDQLAREYVCKLMAELGLQIRVDSFGNIYGRLEGSEKLPPVAMGSHLDTVPGGGNFDGILGVVAALEAVRNVKEQGPLRHPVEVIVFAAEESSRFGHACMGSKVICGSVDSDQWRNLVDANGITLKEALENWDLDIEQLPAARRNKGEWAAFVELHIEQGPVLDAEGIQIGVVEAIAAPTRLRVTVQGVANHSGTTPMHCRQDALAGAAQLVLNVEAAARREAIAGTVGTVGTLTIEPGVMNVIPGKVVLFVDVRGTDFASVSRVAAEVREAATQIAKERQLTIAVETMTADRPVILDPQVCRIIETAAEGLELSRRRMSSGAGHDAMYMASLAPTGMIFIPCRGGISHNGEEYAGEKDVVAGVKILTEVLFCLAR